MIDLDAAATTPIRREVLEAMWPFLTGEYGNPSSRHELGDRAARALASAREGIAAALDCRPGEVVLTSGGTEADNLAVKGIALGAPRGRHVVTTAIEHEAILESAEYLRRFHGFEVSYVTLMPDGTVTPEALRAALRPTTTLVSIGHANNEIGTVQDVEALATVAHEVGAPFHMDAVQSTPWLSVGLRRLGVDAISVSGHKLGAPKGVGALVVDAGVPVEPILHGGGQERGRRSGTENVAFTVGLAAALELAPTLRTRATSVAAARDQLIDGIEDRVPGAFLTGARMTRLPGHASFCFPGTSGEAVLLELERTGFLTSSGSACAAGRDDPPHALLALGIPREVAGTAVRFTFDDPIDAPALVDAVVAAVRAVGGLGVGRSLEGA
jgi:cysteine desulfurase